MRLPTTHSGGKPLYFAIVAGTLRGPYMGWQLWRMKQSGELAADAVVWRPGRAEPEELKWVLQDLCYPIESTTAYGAGSASIAATIPRRAARAVKPPRKELGFLTPEMIDQASLPAESHLEAPERMRVATAATVTYRIAPPGEVVSDDTRHIRMTSLMGARLTGAGFEIVSGGSEVKATLPSGENVWSWDVTPKEHGKRTLKVVVTGHVMLHGRSMPTEYVAETRVIDVKVSLGSYVKQHWMALLGLVLATMSLPHLSEWLKPLLKMLG